MNALASLLLHLNQQSAHGSDSTYHTVTMFVSLGHPWMSLHLKKGRLINLAEELLNCGKKSGGVFSIVAKEPRFEHCIHNSNTITVHTRWNKIWYVALTFRRCSQPLLCRGFTSS